MAKGFLAVLDQAFVSGSNFLMSILLARWLTPKQYGAYGLAFALFVFVSLFYQALLLEPQSVFGPSVYRHCPREYMGALLWGHGGLALAIFLGLGLTAWVVYKLAPSSGLSGALAGVMLSAPCVLLFWLARRAWYVKQAPRPAAFGAIFYSVVVLGGLFAACRRGLLSPFTAFVLMALAAMATSFLLLIRLRPVVNLRNSNLSLRVIIHHHWIYGRWALASSVVNWIPWNIHYGLLGGFAGMADAGAFRALMNIGMPAAQTFSALSLLFLPYAAGIHQKDGPAGIKGLTQKLTLLFAGGATIYWAVAIAFRSSILRFLYAGKYIDLLPLVPWVGLASVFWISANGLGLAMRAMQSPASVFVVYCTSSAVTLAVGIPATKVFALRGAVFAIAWSSVATLVVASLLFRRMAKRACKIRISNGSSMAGDHLAGHTARSTS